MSYALASETGEVLPRFLALETSQVEVSTYEVSVGWCRRENFVSLKWMSYALASETGEVLPRFLALEISQVDVR